MRRKIPHFFFLTKKKSFLSLSPAKIEVIHILTGELYTLLIIKKILVIRFEKRIF